MTLLTSNYEPQSVKTVATPLHLQAWKQISQIMFKMHSTIQFLLKKMLLFKTKVKAPLVNIILKLKLERVIVFLSLGCNNV